MTQRVEVPDEQAAKKMLLWLSFECPKGGNPRDCQAYALRLKPPVERRSWIEGLSGPECVKFYLRHLQCQAAMERRLRQGWTEGQV